MHPLIERIIAKFNKQVQPEYAGALFISSQAAFLVSYAWQQDDVFLADWIEIADAQQIESSVKELLSRHKLETTSLDIVLGGHQYNVIAVDKPDVAEEDLASALKYSAKDYIPGNLEDMLVDYFDVAAQPFGQSKVNLVAAKRPLVESLIKLVLERKIILNQIGIEELAYSEAFGQSDDAVMLITQQENEELLLQIVKQGQLYFYRRIRGYNKLHQFAELEISHGAADNLSLEIQRSLDYFESQLRQAPVKKVYLAVPNANEAMLIEKVGANFPIPVLPLKNWLAQYLNGDTQHYGFLVASAVAVRQMQNTEVVNENKR
ncbi:hypothetical protein C2869_21535 [Saccharobesus litoralis]|uniref:MSHA biogenesis protein MshI n=1 Tax=Saccharobesus litoralis TaxID=2172099 RepID=A0A2S0VXC4_9ALTE|nr:hypothetical protein [Saccharobesus litoralis]AWB68822.1 hypothetical protein C2869_21535 [Saccharobesus litoralis]